MLMLIMPYLLVMEVIPQEAIKLSTAIMSQRYDFRPVVPNYNTLIQCKISVKTSGMTWQLLRLPASEVHTKECYVCSFNQLLLQEQLIGIYFTTVVI